MAVFLQILKVLGIILLCVICILLFLLIVVLFVPIRYQIKGNRKSDEEAAINATIKITWLLHLLTVIFRYPEEAYFKIKLLGITIASTQKKETASLQENKTKTDAKKDTDNKVETENTSPNDLHTEQANGKKKQLVDGSGSNINETESIDAVLEQALEEAETEEEEASIWKFFRKLWENIRNIKYTIQKIYDKIKEIFYNIRYYVRVLHSETFKRAFGLSKEEIVKLLSSILPGKLNANLVIGTGDPASTGQVLAIHGILYPYIGNHIFITPDFEKAVIEGDFYIKGKITLWKALCVAIKIYFNKDIKRVIRLLKREAVTNGRK